MGGPRIPKKTRTLVRNNGGLKLAIWAASLMNPVVETKGPWVNLIGIKPLKKYPRNPVAAKDHGPMDHFGDWTSMVIWIKITAQRV